MKQRDPAERSAARRWALQPGRSPRPASSSAPARSGSTRRPAQLVEGGIEAQTERVLRNLSAVLEAAGLTLDDVVKTTCFLRRHRRLRGVQRGLRALLRRPPPARSTFQVAALPLGARVEIEAIAGATRGAARYAPRLDTLGDGDPTVRPPDARTASISAAAVRPLREQRDRPDPRGRPCSPPASGTRMRSRTPKVLHPICGRPMLAYVLDAARCARRGPTARRRLADDRGRPRRVRDRGRLRAPGRAARHRRRRPRRARRAARRRRPRSSCSPATCRSSSPRSSPTSSPRAGRPRPPWRSSASSVDEPGGLGRVVRDERRPRERHRRGAGRHARAARHRRDQRRPLRLRRRLAARAHRRRRAVARDRRALPARARRARARRRPAGRRASRSTTTARCWASTTAPSWPTPRSRCASASTSAHMRAGVTHRRPGHRLRSTPRSRSPRTSRSSPTSSSRGATEIGRDTIIRSGSQIVDSRVGERCVVWASVLEASIVEARRDHRALRPPPRGRPHRQSAPSSATSPRSRTPASARAPRAPLQLPRRRRGRRAT